MKTGYLYLDQESIRAILERRKSQLRVPLIPTRSGPVAEVHETVDSFSSNPQVFQILQPYRWSTYRKGLIASYTQSPFGQPGDILWVREAWRVIDHDFGTWRAGLQDPPPTAWLIDYPAGGDPVWRNPPNAAEMQRYAKIFGTAEKDGGPDDKLRTAVSMPHWAARIHLEVKAIGAQRRSEISVDQCMTEGLTFDRSTGTLAISNGTDTVYCTATDTIQDAHFVMKLWWNRRFKRKRQAWDDTEWVWWMSFEARIPGKAKVSRIERVR